MNYNYAPLQENPPQYILNQFDALHSMFIPSFDPGDWEGSYTDDGVLARRIYGDTQSYVRNRLKYLRKLISHELKDFFLDNMCSNQHKIERINALLHYYAQLHEDLEYDIQYGYCTSACPNEIEKDISNVVLGMHDTEKEIFDELFL